MHRHYINWCTDIITFKQTKAAFKKLGDVAIPPLNGTPEVGRKSIGGPCAIIEQGHKLCTAYHWYPVSLMQKQELTQETALAPAPFDMKYPVHSFPCRAQCTHYLWVLGSGLPFAIASCMTKLLHGDDVVHNRHINTNLLSFKWYILKIMSR